MAIRLAGIALKEEESIQCMVYPLLLILAVGGLEPKVLVVKKRNKMEDNKCKQISHMGGSIQRGRVYSPKGISPCLNLSIEPKFLVKKEEDNMEELTKDDLAIRRITETEAWRLMGFTDDDINKAKAVGVSKTQLFKQAGNSIVTNVLYHIYNSLYDAMPYLFDNLKVGSFFSGIGAFEKALDNFYADKEKNHG